MGIVVYISTVSSNMEIKKHQQKIEMILTGKGINAEFVDISASEDSKLVMRQGCGDPTALPPQIFNDAQYCGDYAAFEEALECETLIGFLKL